MQTSGAEDGSETIYFVCPHCQQRYDVCRVSAEGICLRNFITRIQKAGGKADHLKKKYADCVVNLR
jgi:hypothetical protein